MINLNFNQEMAERLIANMPQSKIDEIVIRAKALGISEDQISKGLETIKQIKEKNN